MIEFMTSPILWGPIIAVLLTCYAIYLFALPKPIPGIPHHHRSAKKLLGDAPSMVAHFMQNGTVTDWMSQQGSELESPVFQLFLKPFSKPAVFVIDPREAYDVVHRRSQDFDRSQFLIDVAIGTGPTHHICQPTNALYWAGRRLVADTMSSGFLKKVAAPRAHKHVLNLLDLWRIKNDAGHGYPFEAGEDVRNMALDSIWEVAFGTELAIIPDDTRFLERILSLEPPLIRDGAAEFRAPERSPHLKTMHTFTDSIDTSWVSPAPRQTHWVLRQAPSYRRAVLHKDQLIKERLDDAKDRLLNSTATDEYDGITCATDHLVRREAYAAVKENRSPVYDSQLVSDELYGFLLIGHDTTATSLMWAVKLLAANPQAQSRLRTILHSQAFKSFHEAGICPSADAISTIKVPYLEATIEEIIRCGQPVSTAIRKATHDTELLGYSIPKGTDVYFLTNGPGYSKPNLPTWMISENVRSPTSRENKEKGIPLWNPEDVEAFKPERWLKTNENGIDVFNPFAGPVMQFGGGVRGCFGKKLAYLELRTLLVLLIWRFELLHVPEHLAGMGAIDAITHKPKKCYVRLRELD